MFDPVLKVEKEINGVKVEYVVYASAVERLNKMLEHLTEKLVRLAEKTKDGTRGPPSWRKSYQLVKDWVAFLTKYRDLDLAIRRALSSYKLREEIERAIDASIYYGGIVVLDHADKMKKGRYWSTYYKEAYEGVYGAVLRAYVYRERKRGKTRKIEVEICPELGLVL